MILCAKGKGAEAVEEAGRCLADRGYVEQYLKETVDLFVRLAAAGHGKEVLEVLRESASADMLEPLVVGVRMYLGEDVRAAAEMMEVGKDVVKRIEDRREGQRGAGSV